MKLIDKDALVAEIEKWLGETDKGFPNDHNLGRYDMCKQMLSFLDTLEVKEVGISIPNIDNTLKEEGFDPDSKEAKVFKESYYMALEGLKAQEGE